MKTTANGRISAAQDTLRQGAGWSAHYVAHLTVNSTIYYYSTRAITLSGNDYTPELVATGTLERSLGEGRELLGLVDATDIVFSNARTADATEGRSAGSVEALHNLYRLEGAPIQVGVLFNDAGADEDDIIWLNSMVVDDVVMSDSPPTITLRCVDSTLATGERVVGRMVDDQTFPESYKQARGKMLPIVFGSVRDAPLIPIDIGFTGAIDGSLLFNETTVFVTDITDFPDTGSAWIEDEVIRWTGRDTANAALTDVFRGEQSTVATDHPDGALLAEYKTGAERYRFAVADHACNAVTNVRAGGKLRTAGAGDDEYVSTTLTDPYGEGRDIEVIEFKQPPRYPMTSAYSRALPIIQEPDEPTALPDYPYPEEQEFNWSKGAGDNLGAISGGIHDGEDYAELCIDQTIPRIGAALQDTRDHLQITLDTDLTNGHLGTIRRARVKCEYFTASENTNGAAIRVSHGGTELANVPLAAAVPEDLAMTGTGHEHGLDSGVLDIPRQGVTIIDEGNSVQVDFDKVLSGADNDVIDGDHNTAGRVINTFFDNPTDSKIKTDGITVRSDSAPSNGGVLQSIRVKAWRTGIVTNETSGFDIDSSLKTRLTISGAGPFNASNNTSGIEGDYSETTLLTIDNCVDRGITWDMLILQTDLRVELRSTTVSTVASGTALVDIADVWIEALTETGITAFSAHDGSNISGRSEVDGLEDIAASSSLAIQTVPFTYALDQYIAANALDDRWAIFDGTLDLDVEATGPIADGSSTTDDRIYITRLWIELELREATIMLDWNQLTADVEGVTRSATLLDNPVDLLRYVIISPDTSNSVPDFGYMGLAQSAIDTITADRAAHRLNGGFVSGFATVPDYAFNRRIDQPTSALRLISTICQDCHLRVFREGETFQFHVVDIGMQSPVATLDGTNVYEVTSKDQTTTAQVANEVSIRYNADYAFAFGAALGYESQITAGDSVSQAMPWGKRSATFTAPWLANQDTDAQASNDLASWWAAFLGVKWSRISMLCSLEVVDLERQDHVLIDLPYQGLPNLIGRVVGVRFPRLDAAEVMVEIPQYTSRCFSSGYQDGNNMFWKSAGNQTLSLRLAGIEATWFSPDWWTLPGGEFVQAAPETRSTGPVEILDTYEAGELPASAYINFKKTADVNWTSALKITIQDNKQRKIESNTNLSFRNGYDLSGEQAYSQCVFADQTEGSVTISLGGQVVAKIVPFTTGSLTGGVIYVNGNIGDPGYASGVVI